MDLIIQSIRGGSTRKLVCVWLIITIIGVATMNQFLSANEAMLPTIDTNLTQLINSAIFKRIQNFSGEDILPTIDTHRSQDIKNVIPQRSLYMKSKDDFYDYIEKPHFHCNNYNTFGGALVRMSVRSVSLPYIDGDKIVCLDSPYFTPGNCIIYSFGINNEWSFDDEMDKLGCAVYAFDPTINLSKFTRGRNISFYPIGITGSNTKFETNPSQYKTFGNIKKMLHHDKEDVVINYLKMDVEGAEMDFMQDVLITNPNMLNNVKQISMEIHPGFFSKPEQKVHKKLYKYFMLLENKGFQLFHYAMNPVPTNQKYDEVLKKIVNCCYELVWVNRSL